MPPDVPGERASVALVATIEHPRHEPEAVDLSAVGLPPLDQSVTVHPDGAQIGKREFSHHSTRVELPEPVPPPGPALAAGPARSMEGPTPAPRSASALSRQPAQKRLDAFLGTVSEPEAWQNFPPEYPEAARRRGWSGTVTLRVRIGADGQVLEVSVAESSGHEVLDAAAVVAIRTWRYRPARLGQEPIEYTLRQPVQFELTGRSR